MAPRGLERDEYAGIEWGLGDVWLSAVEKWNTDGRDVTRIKTDFENTLLARGSAHWCLEP